jgi:RNA polymerase sigma-70 factor (ECF subfamily)
MDRTSVALCIGQARAGEAQALAALLQRYRGYVHLLARTCLDRRLQSKADPSDVVQDTMLRVHRGFPRFRGSTEAELLAWMRKVLASTLADLQRRFLTAAGRRITLERSLEKLVESSSTRLGNLLVAREASPGQCAGEHERSLRLADALARLAADDREVITLRNLEELEWSEVAQRLERSADAARMLWTRALRRLGDELAAEEA